MKEAKAETGFAGREKKSAAPGSSSMETVRSLPGHTRSFLADVRAEMKRVTWPTWKQVQSTTLVVLVTVFFFGVYFGVLDWIYTALVGWLIKLGS